ncbi:hypothetical protein Ancab_002166, partial [Ancistrocladus abbreviatus]
LIESEGFDVAVQEPFKEDTCKIPLVEVKQRFQRTLKQKGLALFPNQRKAKVMALKLAMKSESKKRKKTLRAQEYVPLHEWHASSELSGTTGDTGT